MWDMIGQLESNNYSSDEIHEIKLGGARSRSINLLLSTDFFVKELDSEYNQIGY